MILKIRIFLKKIYLIMKISKLLFVGAFYDNFEQ